MRIRATALLAAASIGLVGCSTTANTSTDPGGEVVIDEGAGGSTAGSGAGAASGTDQNTADGNVPAARADGADGQAGDGGTSGATSDGSGSGTTSGSGSGSSAGASSGAGGTTPEPTGPQLVQGSGHGYTEDEIYVGIQLVVDTGPAFAAVGATGGNAVAPDEEAIAQTMVDYINATGGIAGRTLVPIYHQTQILSGTWASQAAATCAAFTEDNEVVAAVTSASGGSDDLWGCTSERGLPLVERNIWPWDDQYFTSKPDMLYVPGKMSADRWVDHYVDGLAEIGFYDDATIGVLHFDGQPFERLLDGRLLPALERHGVTPAMVTAITRPPSVGSFGNMTSEINNALVQFRSRGVTHIMMLEWAGILPFFALPSADQQRYYPQWGFSSNDIPMTLNAFASQEQLANGQGVSWVPPTDVVLLEDADDPARVKREQPCMEAYGGRAGHHNGSMCDALLFLQSAFNRARDLSPAGLASVVRGLGRGYQSPMGISTFLGDDVFHDGADAIRYFDWMEGCTTVEGEELGCYQYVSQAKSTPR